MSGVTDLPFRMLCRRFGCELAFIEMLNARSVSSKSRRSKEMLAMEAKDRPLGVQLLGKEPGYILRALDILEKYKFDVLDFNAACPAKKVVRRGEGAALMQEPSALEKILKLLVKKVTIPVTVKIRSGWDDNSVNAVEVAKRAEAAGISAVIIHGRTKTQEYSGGVRYHTIKEVKQALKIPLIASGDIFSPQLAKKMLSDTGCDGIAVARGALGNPWIFRQLEDFITHNRTYRNPEKEQICKTMLEHLQANIDFYGERIGVVKFRKFFSCYTMGLRKVRPLREKSSRAKLALEMQSIIRESCSQ